MSAAMESPYAHIREALDPQNPGRKFYNLSKLEDPRYGKMSEAESADGHHRNFVFILFEDFSG